MLCSAKCSEQAADAANDNEPVCGANQWPIRRHLEVEFIFKYRIHWILGPAHVLVNTVILTPPYFCSVSGQWKIYSRNNCSASILAQCSLRHPSFYVLPYIHMSTVNGISPISDVVLITGSETGVFEKITMLRRRLRQSVSHYFRICGYFCDISLHPGRELCKSWPVMDV
jgi:hypothetical protein